MLTDGRSVPLGELRLWAPGQDSPIVGERESVFYDTRDVAFNAGGVTYDGNVPELEYFRLGAPKGGNEDSGALVCKPRLVLKDTRSADWSTTGGGWEERRPSTGAVRTYRLVQYDSSADVVWGATSNFSLPANPSVAFSLSFIDTPPDWDEATYPPYVQIAFGGGQYAIYITKSDAFLLAWDALTAGFVPVANLPACRAADNSDNAESLIVLRCNRGMVLVSTDAGDRYSVAGTGYDGVHPLAVPAGPIVVSGQGGMLVFGLHQLLMTAGTWTAPPRSVREVHSDPLQLSARMDETYGTVALTDTSTPADKLCRYTCELTPTSTLLSGPGWSVYRSPEVYSVLARYVAKQSALGFTGINFVQPDLLEATVTKPRELDGAGGSVVCRLSQFDESGNHVENWWNYGRWTKYLLRLGHGAEGGGGDTLEDILVGFVTDVRMESLSYNDVTLRLTLGTVAERFRQAKWSKLDTFPLGGRTLNQALDLILETEGIPRNASYRNWDYISDLYWFGLGDVFALPAGYPEDPFEWPRPGETKWATMQRLAGYAGLEVVPLDTGVLTTLPKVYVPPAVSATFKAEPLDADTLQRLAMQVAWSLNSRESATSVLVDGKDANGEVVFGYAVDTQAEQNPLSPRFSPFRVEITETLDGTCSAALVIGRAAELAREFFSNAETVDLQFPVDLTLSRRLRVRVEGFEHINLPPWLDFQVVSLEHRYRAQGGFGPELATVASLELTRS